MKINELLNAVAKLVVSRQTIDHGSIRMLHDDNAAREICAAEGCDEVDLGSIGDDDLAKDLSDLADNGDQIAKLDLDDLVSLQDEFRGEDLSDYVERESEDELKKLDRLIDAARELV